MDGSGPIEFEVQTPLNAEIINAHIDHAMSLGLPFVQANHGGTKRATIFGSGPSARNVGYTKGVTVACNNALTLFGADGPDFWVACDPQQIVADFLPDEPPKNTVYLLATKCHPDVFRKLQGHNVMVWQLDDYPLRPGPLGVPTAVSVTLCAINLLAQMGYANIETWGWDGCYIDGKSYANPQPHNAERITVHLKDQAFETTHTWAMEAEDFRNQMMRDAGHYTVKINGPGMIGAIARYFGLAT